MKMRTARRTRAAVHTGSRAQPSQLSSRTRDGFPQADSKRPQPLHDASTWPLGETMPAHPTDDAMRDAREIPVLIRQHPESRRSQ